MGSRIKEDQRIEKAIRSLLKLPENRRCINCNSLGPQYVCSTFWTFVCVNCSGIHREFTHRVKSISMAKFTAEEVSALRAGGNERARQVYFKEWDTQRDVYPDSSNIFKLRDFIKSVYVEKRYSTESNDKISKHKPAVVEDYKESKKASANILGPRRFHSMDTSELERSSDIGRSGTVSLKYYFEEQKPKPQQNPKSRVLPKSPARFEIVDDRFRDDGIVKRYDVRKELSRGNSKSVDLSSNKETSSLPIIRHTSELLGENDPNLRITVEKKKDPVNNQKTASSHKKENPRSLIDDVPVDETIKQSPSEKPASVKKTEEPAPNSLEALLFGDFSPSGTNNYELWSQRDSSSTASAPNLGIQTISKTPETVTSSVTSPKIEQSQSSYTGSSGPLVLFDADNLNITETATPSVAANNQIPSNTCMELSTLDISNSAHDVRSENHHHHQDETESSIRKALPEDLFSGGFSFDFPQVHSQQHAMGYGMQYYQYPVQPMGALTYTSKPSNPFDCDDTTPNITPQYPSMGIMQAPIGYSDSSNLAADSYGVMNSQSPYYTTNLSPNSPSFASNLTPGDSFNGAHTYHQANNGYPSSNPNAYISRGNPFE